MSRARRILRGVWIGAGALVALVVLLVAFVLFTPPGAKLALWVAKGRDLPFRAEAIQGTLARRFVLHDVALAFGPVEAKFDTVMVAWDPRALRDHRVQVSEALIAGGKVRIRTAVPDTTATLAASGAASDTSAATPWIFTAHHLRVRNVSVDAPEQGVHVRDLDLEGSGGPDGYRARVHAAGTVPPLSDVRVLAEASGDMRAATMDTLHVHALGGEVRGGAFVRWDPTLSWHARVAGDSLRVTPLLPPTEERIGPVSFRAASTGWVREDSMRIGLDLDALEGTLRGRPLSARGRVDMEGRRISASDVRVQWGTARVSLSGTLDEDVVDATLDATIPALGEVLPQARGSASVRGNVAGSAGNFAVDVDVTGRGVRMDTVELPDFDASVDAIAIADKYVPHTARIHSVRITTAAGEVDARGTVSWQDGIAWDGVLAADSVQLSTVAPAKGYLRGPVSLRVSTEGTKRGDRLRGRVAIESLSGTVRDRALDGSGNVALDNGEIDVSSLQVQWGDTRVSADGHVGDRLNVEFHVVAPNLAAVDSSLHGSIRLRGSASGPRDKPHLMAEITADSVQALTYAARRLEGHVDADLAFESPADVHLLALDVAGGEIAADTLRVRVSGPRDDQRAALSVVAGHARASLELRGAFADTTWSGWVEEARVAHDSTRTWQLRGRAPVFLSRSRASVDSLVLTSRESQLAVGGSWQRGDSTRARLELDDLELAVLQRFLAEGVQVTGTADADASIAVGPDGAIVARVHVVPGPGTLALADRKVTYEGRVTGHSDATGVFAQVDLSLRDAGEALATVDGELSIAGFVLGRDSTSTQPIEGRIDVNVTNIAPVMALVDPSLTGDASGTLTAHLSPVGTAEDFRIMGRVMLEDGRVDLRNGLQLRDTDVMLVSDGKGNVTLDGAVTSGGGRVVLKAESARSEKGWVKGTFTAQGERFLLVNQPEARVYVSPDLNVQTSERVAQVTGRVRVPYARIETAEVPASAVSASSDVVVIEDTLATKPAWQVRTDVRVELGDSVTFSGFGLQARLAGSLTVHDERGQPTRGSGEIQIVEGKYRAYGNELRIDQGRFIFGGGPVDNPGLDIRATRGLTTQNVMAGSGEMVGLNLRGTLRQPEVSLFSNPSMSDSEIMSYLVLGRPLDSGEDQSALASAALLVGMQQGSGIAGDIGEAFALDEAYIEGGEDVRETSFVAGKYLSPKVYIAYATGLFEKTNTFRVRYSIDRKWTLQAESGDESSTDLLYWFERGKK